MKKLYIIVLSMMLSGLAVANGSEQGHNNGNGHSDDTPNTVVQTVDSNIGIDIEGAASASADSAAFSGAVVNSEVTTGGSESSAKSYSGGGEASVGSVEAVTGDSSSNIGDLNISTGNTAAHSAAPLFASICQSGVSAQAKDWGFSTLSPDSICEMYKSAQAQLMAYEYELKKSFCAVERCNVQCDGQDAYLAGDRLQCPSEAAADHHRQRAAVYYERYEWYMDQIFNTQKGQALIDKADRVAKKSIVPGLLIYLLAL